MNNLLPTGSFKRFHEGQFEYVYLPGNGVLKITNVLIKQYLDACGAGSIGNYISKELADQISLTLKENIYVPEFDPNTKQNNAMLTINITNGCNMACKYCFAMTAKEKTKNITIESVAIATRDLINLYPDVMCYTIYFFGGEPLMRKEFLQEAVCIIKKIMQENSKEVKFIITTNGTLLDSHIIDFLKKESFHIVVSIDGNSQHNFNRIFRNGKETFNTVYDNIKLLKEKKVSMHLRATFNPLMNNLLDAVKFFESLEIIYDYEFTLGSNINDDQYTRFSQDKLPLISKEIEAITNYLMEKVENGENIYCSSLLQKIVFIQNRIIRHYGCEAGRNALIVDESGDYYPCQNMLSFPETKIGDINHGINKDIKNRCKSQLFSEYSKCNSCWARYLCGGGCQAERMMEEGANSSSNAVCKIIKTEWLYALKAYTRLKIHQEKIEQNV